MQCSDTNGELPAIHITKQAFDLARRLMQTTSKIQTMGGVGDTEVRLRLQPDGTVKSINYSFSEPGEKRSA